MLNAGKPSVVKNLPVIQETRTGNSSSILGLETFPGKGNDNPVCILAWKILRTEETGRLQSMGSQKSWTIQQTLTALG